MGVACTWGDGPREARAIDEFTRREAVGVERLVS